MTPDRSRLRWLDMFTEAASAISQRPVRALLTALGTILGVGAFVATTGLADTARAQVSARFDALKATEVRVQPSSPVDGNPFPVDASQRLARLNGVNHGGVLFVITDDGMLQPRGTATRLPDGSTPGIPVVAADPGALLAALPTIDIGRLYDDFHQGRGERVAVLGRIAAQRLGIARVDNQPAVFVGDDAYTVVGIIDDVRRQPDLLLSVVIPTTSLSSTMRTSGSTFEVLIDTRPGAAALIGRQAPLALRPDAPEALQSLVPPDPKRLRNQVTGDVTGLFYALSGLALLIGTIAITNATLVNVIERRSEIGLRRALGATRRHIRRQIMLEAAMVGAMGGVVGAVLGLAATTAVSLRHDWALTINPLLPVAAPVIGLAAGALAGLLPSVRAARTPPAETLRS